MPEVPIPFTDQSVDSDDDAPSIVMTIVGVLAGFALLAWLRGVADNLANEANSFISNLIGYDPTSGENTQEDPLF
jgi:hypothetical protein